MKLRVLGSSGAEFPNFNPPGFLIDGCIMLDAGTIGAVLKEREQWDIRHIFITHAHLDHIKAIPFLADNLILKNKKHSVTVISLSAVLKTIKGNLLNGTIWPDFTRIPPENPVIRLKAIQAGRHIRLNRYMITAYMVNHSVPAVGYIVRDTFSSLLYTGDTGPTNAIWKNAKNNPVNTVIVEVSFPNSMSDLAVKTGHLTASLLKEELKKLGYLPKRILITHPKPQYYARIKTELDKLKIKGLSILRDEKTYEV